MSEAHQEQEIDQIVYEAIGRASMCWSEIPSGVFDSTKAKEIGDELIAKLKRRVFLESAIKGHMEAMRPLLDEWSGRL